MTKDYIDDLDYNDADTVLSQLPFEHIDIGSTSNDEYNSEDDYVLHKEIMYDQTNDNYQYSYSISKLQYTILRIGITSLIISNTGVIRKVDDMLSTSIGFALPGTPYRTYPVEIQKNQMEEYFVHDLVWRAFNGEPPEGYEVRHTFWEAKKGHEYYDNSLENLEIYPTTITYLPSTRKTLPEPVL